MDDRGHRPLAPDNIHDGIKIMRIRIIMIKRMMMITMALTTPLIILKTLKSTECNKKKLS